MRFISWNVNGIRACLNKGFNDFFLNSEADFFCIQESKAKEEQVEYRTDGYYQYWYSAIKPGYSGTVIFCKEKPQNIAFDFNTGLFDDEGRVLTLEFTEFYLVNTYTPNSQRGLTRLDYRLSWQDAYLTYIQSLDKHKPVILCGDLNVAHHEIDIKNPKGNRNNAGFTDQERAKMSELLEIGLVDTFRYFHPEQTDAYTWWSYMGGARARNTGWRIDYFLASERLKNRFSSAAIHPEIMGSDHCPISFIIS